MGLSLQTYPTASEAQSALAASNVRYMGGGTLVVRAANEGDLSFSTIVRTTDPALSEIETSEAGVRIGASATMGMVLAHPQLSYLAPAARAVGGPAVRNMATVGGNLFAPAPYGDFTVALLALEANVSVAGSGEMALETFLQEREGLDPSALVTAVSFAPPPDSFRFLKISRVHPKGAAVLTIATDIREETGSIARARIALGCMADRAIRARRAEAALVGRPRTQEGIAPALAAALEGIDPPTDAIASAWYRREVLPVHLGRLLLG
ncbi:FAD binding domain-containing protein [Chelativorans salis]|uniref:FAD binding domain-containing protein n=1 Tax=Chelativorans salis TaxID=2978478 RepID=A0ABT2LTQ3_9HYPH|nr:FAD binding domain-containing protein [Chelativorans sp. EGI FJ00035]MCT7377232.1 FAD binding domain-containing protein [Chelativorans sp. EGI FJ00035]